MTIGAIILLVIVTLLIIIGSALILVDTDISGFTALLVDFILLGVIWGGAAWYYNCTASGKRAMKTQESNLGNGIERELTVYDMQGEVIEQYKGRFDIDFGNTESGERVVFDDENGMRHVIYPGGGVVIINEVGE